MNGYIQFKKNIHRRLVDLEGTIRELEQSQLVEGSTASGWREPLAQVRASLEDSLLRVAVVGAVKSGKSTLINSLLGVDLLKRGAGIITAFIARVRTHGEVGGWVELKPWKQILDELNATLRLIPLLAADSQEKGRLDIRHEEDRCKLQSLLERARTECLETGGAFDPTFLVLNGYMEGYERLHAAVAEKASRISLDPSSIGQHHHYVGHEGQAVYVRDMELHIPIGWLGDNVEIGDCQGSDSPNPLHFALLQQYLLRSHFILYVINSRTGLREADLKLLQLIKTLRMFPQTLFVLNVDLDVHPALEDLERLTQRVRGELGWVVPNPQVHAFSALFQLLEQIAESASEREKRRCEIWKADPELIQHSRSCFHALREQMGRRITGQRTRILLGSGLSRISVVSNSVLDTLHAQEQFMNQNLGSLQKSSEQLKKKQKILQGTLGTLENAISGLKDSLKQELESAVEEYFDLTEGPIVKETTDMVERYPIHSLARNDLTDYRQLPDQLHRFYLKFRQDLYRFLVDQVNLRVIEFAKDEEAFLHERLRQSSHAFWSLYKTALEDYRNSMAQFNIEVRLPDEIQEWEWSWADKVSPPSFSGFMDQGAVGRGILMVKFGLGRLSRFLVRLKSTLGKRKGAMRKGMKEDELLQEAVSLVKSETKSELMEAFAEYRKKFQYGYLYRLLEDGTRNMLEEFTSRAEVARLDFASLLKQGEVEGEGRQSLVDVLSLTSRKVSQMVKELEELRCAVNLEWMPQEGGSEGDGRNASNEAPKV